MSNHEQHEDAHQNKKKEMTRRQFLSYTLGGTTAFMMGGPLLPMLRFAIEPLLAQKSGSSFVKVVEESKITSEPLECSFQVFQKDGWYDSKPTLVAWVARDSENNVYALSPICKHLGCTIDWNTKGRNEFDCPCHDARYDKNGKNIAIANSPLDEYEVEVRNGFVYLGALKPNTRTK